ncbi:MAG: NAD-dependent deacetylase [Rhodocyclaceae bacterium]|nr:NAD-dependent deacetylase [Rhodocyclaceae bacterium]
MTAIDPALLDRAARLIDAADGLLITAGAGMGVDSGLPDFRGPQGFWSAYPALGKARIDFQSIASPRAFEERPRMAWGFYGHRLALYRATLPHDGFRILLDWADQMPTGAFVFTSNVDGQFQKAGFKATEICEVHGSIHHLQCLAGCAGDIWPATGFEPVVDETRCLLTGPTPTCPHCGGLARPNILMFSDWGWLEFRERIQRAAMNRWLERVERPVVVELGAGTNIPTARMAGESLDAPLIRINPAESDVAHPRDVALPTGALAGLQGIDAALLRLAGTIEIDPTDDN